MCECSPAHLRSYLMSPCFPSVKRLTAVCGLSLTHCGFPPSRSNVCQRDEQVERPNEQETFLVAASGHPPRHQNLLFYFTDFWGLFFSHAHTNTHQTTERTKALILFNLYQSFEVFWHAVRNAHVVSGNSAFEFLILLFCHHTTSTNPLPPRTASICLLSACAKTTMTLWVTMIVH